MFDKTVKEQSDLWADGIVEAILDSMNNPERPLKGEALSVFNYLKDWDAFGDFTFNSTTRNIIASMLSIEQYKKLMHNQKIQNKKGMSKWERVAGKLRK
jgi:hypothetical protein